MPYTAIHGDFIIWNQQRPSQGPEPDGDTLRFVPQTPSLVEGLSNSRTPDWKRGGAINIRFEGIDALETHFSGMHQNLDWAIAARDYMLEQAGFQAVEWIPDNEYKVSEAEPHPAPGWTLANTLGTHGRLVAFVYAGTCPYADGEQVWLDAPLTRQSLNGQLLRRGLAYATYYEGLPIDIQDTLSSLSIDAWNRDRGLWPEDVSPTWTRLRTLAHAEEAVMWPKLFRRLARYFAAGYVGLGRFDSWLRADPAGRDDRLLFVREGEVGNMHDMIEIDGDWIRLRYWPEDVVVLGA